MHAGEVERDLLGSFRGGRTKVDGTLYAVPLYDGLEGTL